MNHAALKITPYKTFSLSTLKIARALLLFKLQKLGVGNDDEYDEYGS